MESNCDVIRKICEHGAGITYTKALEEVLGLGVNLELTALGVLDIKGGNLWDVLILALSLLFLELEGDTTDRATLDTLHEMCGVTGDLVVSSEGRLSEICSAAHLVAETLGGNDSNFIANSLVGLEVESELGVVTLNDDLGGLLNGLGTNATHDC